MKKLFLFVFIFFLQGCATPKFLQPINGSKADGTVTMAYEYSAFESPQIDWNSANSIAKSRCVAWGYSNAQAFGGQQSRCTLSNAYGDCFSMQVSVVYQCTK